MRLIDADALPKYTGYALSADEVATAVENAPTIDAVPVVRCRKCDGWVATGNSDLGLCALTKRVVTRRDYCSWGRRKDGAE